jgi:hypothetical protein
MTLDEVHEQLAKGQRLIDIKFHYTERGHEAIILTEIGKLLNVPTLKGQVLVHNLLLSGTS